MEQQDQIQSVTPASSWKTTGPIARTGSDEIVLPSGNVCRARPLQPEAFLSSGFIPDFLQADVNKAIRDKKGLPPQSAMKIMQSPEKIHAAIQMIDVIACYVVVEPKCEMPPTCVATQPVGEEPCGKYYTETKAHDDRDDPNFHTYLEGDRNPAVLYADRVDMDDKMFLFNWAVGGTADVARFREELAGNVGSVPARKKNGNKGKQSRRNR